MTLADVLALDDDGDAAPPQPYRELAQHMLRAREHNRAVVVFIGGHVIKQGLSRFLIDMLERGYISLLAMNGAAAIHDAELTLFGVTDEPVDEYLSRGQFGMWGSFESLTLAANRAIKCGEGYGEALGGYLDWRQSNGEGLGDRPSVLAAAYRAQIPVTIHSLIGGDVFHLHPYCRGDALGEASLTDLRIFTHHLFNLGVYHGEGSSVGGVFLNIGSAVTGPEVFLKGLSAVRNVADRQGYAIEGFTTAVFDILPLPQDWATCVLTRTDPAYYFRPLKTVLRRAVTEVGHSYYVCGDHRLTIPSLHYHLCHKELT